MPGSRFHRFESEGYAYFVTTVVAERRPIFAEPDAAELFLETLYENRRRYGFLLLSFAVMQDHVHLILLPAPRNSISDVMRHIKGSFARTYNERNGGMGAVWQRSFYEKAIQSERALRETLDYIEANPVVAGYVPEARQYACGSASGRFETDIEQFLA